MSPVTTYTSRRGEVPCGDADLYAFLTDMRNLQTVVPAGILTDWVATEDHCSFRIEKVGKISASLSEALPHSVIRYDAVTFLGKNDNRGFNRIHKWNEIGILPRGRSAHESHNEDVCRP